LAAPFARDLLWPLVGAAFILMARGDELVVARDARYIALWFRPVSRTGSGPKLKTMEHFWNNRLL